MAKRKAKASARKTGRKARPRATGTATRQAKARQSSRKSARRQPAAKPKARLRAPGASASARRATTDRSARQAAARKAARPRAAARRSAPAKPARHVVSRPKPAALSRERRQLREDETVPGAPSSLNFATRASAAESGHQMYNQRAKEHTEGGNALTGGDVDSDWNDAYSSGEETPGGDMSTPDQDVVEEIGRALGVEYEDSEELKGAEKIENRDRNRWEYDPASAEDYKDRNRRDS
jgi:hypothetical protein